MTRTRNSTFAMRTAALVAVTALLAACGAAPSKPSKPSKQASAATPTIAVDAADAGFTIAEPAPVNEAVRLDYAAAIAQLDAGDRQRGVETLEQVTESAPALSAPRIDLGIAQHAAGNLEEAARQLEMALEISPGHPVAATELGIVYRKLGRFEDARRSYEAALAVYPGYHYARRNLGILCDLYLADLECALASYEAYLQTVPGDAEAEMWVADIRNRLGR